MQGMQINRRRFMQTAGAGALLASSAANSNLPAGRAAEPESNPEPAREMVEPMDDSDFVRLIILDPAHFHAALVQKQMLPGIAKRVAIYAPLGSDLLARVRKSAQVLREVPFSSRTDTGLLEGKIDLLFREDDNWVLVDYKTDSRIDADRYRAQLEAYKQAVKHIAGVDVHETLLFFLAEGKMIRMSL